MIVWMLAYGLIGILNVGRQEIAQLESHHRWYNVKNEKGFSPGGQNCHKNNSKGFDMAFGFRLAQLEPSIATWTVNYIKKNGTKDKITEPMVSRNCSQPISDESNSTHAEKFLKVDNKVNENGTWIFDNLTCTDAWNQNLTGDYFSKEFQYIEMSLKICQGNKTCKNRTEIEKFFKNHALDIVYKDTYSDHENRTHPQKEFVEDKYWLQLDLNKRQLTDFFIQKATINSNYWWTKSLKSEQSYRMGRIKEALKDPDLEGGEIFKAIVRLEDSELVIDQKTFGFTEFFASLGGLISTYKVILKCVVIITAR